MVRLHEYQSVSYRTKVAEDSQTHRQSTGGTARLELLLEEIVTFAKVFFF